MGRSIYMTGNDITPGAMSAQVWAREVSVELGAGTTSAQESPPPPRSPMDWLHFLEPVVSALSPSLFTMMHVLQRGFTEVQWVQLPSTGMLEMLDKRYRILAWSCVTGMLIPWQFSRNILGASWIPSRIHLWWLMESFTERERMDLYHVP